MGDVRANLQSRMVWKAAYSGQSLPCAEEGTSGVPKEVPAISPTK